MKMFLFSLLSLLAPLAAAAELPAGYKLLYEQKFDNESSLKQFQMTDANAWKWVTTDDGHGGSMELFQQSKYKPVVRSPVNIALDRQ
jgi:hypothetical protein